MQKSWKMGIGLRRQQQVLELARKQIHSQRIVLYFQIYKHSTEKLKMGSGCRFSPETLHIKSLEALRVKGLVQNREMSVDNAKAWLSGDLQISSTEHRFLTLLLGYPLPAHPAHFDVLNTTNQLTNALKVGELTLDTKMNKTGNTSWPSLGNYGLETLNHHCSKKYKRGQVHNALCPGAEICTQLWTCTQSVLDWYHFISRPGGQSCHI